MAARFAALRNVHQTRLKCPSWGALSLAYKDTPRQDAYRLERVDGETVEGMAIFYTTAEANEVINHLGPALPLDAGRQADMAS